MIADHVLVLASASPARLGLLKQAGLNPRVVVSGVDEDAVSANSAAELTAVLAEAKAAAVAGQLPFDALVIGCDSLLDLGDGEPLGKPRDARDAFERWQRMRGRSGVLHTGHCVIDTVTGRRVNETVSTTVWFGMPDDEEIAAYVRAGEPLRVAGAFTLDGLSAPFVEGIEGDPSNVVGLSLPLLRRILIQLGYRITDLWD